MFVFVFMSLFFKMTTGDFTFLLPISLVSLYAYRNSAHYYLEAHQEANYCCVNLLELFTV